MMPGAFVPPGDEEEDCLVLECDALVGEEVGDTKVSLRECLREEGREVREEEDIANLVEGEV